MQRFVIAALLIVLAASCAEAAGRGMLQQQPTITATILMTRASAKQNVCSATVVLRAADGSPVQDATVIYKWDSATVGRTAISSAAGRINTMSTAGPDASSCTLQLLSVSVAGVPVMIATTSRAPRSISWV